MRWRGTWAAAQITGVVASSFVWLMVLGLASHWTMLVLGVVGLAIAVRDTRLGLWWRYGARPATTSEAAPVLAALVPLAALRGRRQPRVWIGASIGHHDAVLPTSMVLVVGTQLPRSLEQHHSDCAEMCALVSHARGLLPVRSSLLVVAVLGYCLPWSIVDFIVHHISGVLRRLPLTVVAWRIRWLVFGVALVQSAQASRWPAFIGVVIIAVLSGTIGVLRSRWLRTQTLLGDQQVIANGYGPTLCRMIQAAEPTALQAARLDRLQRHQPETLRQAPSRGVPEDPGSSPCRTPREAAKRGQHGHNVPGPSALRRAVRWVGGPS